MDLRACIRTWATSLLFLGGTELTSWLRGMETAAGWRNTGSSIPNWHVDSLVGKTGRHEECAWKERTKYYGLSYPYDSILLTFSDWLRSIATVGYFDILFALNFPFIHFRLMELQANQK